MMRKCRGCGFLLALLFAAPLLAQTPARSDGLTQAQINARAKAQNVPEIPFESVPNFLKFPANLYMGEGIGVATNSKGHVFVYTRSQETRLFEFDPKGNFVREIGEGLYGFAFAHAVRVDPQDNIWAVDEGSNMVIKFNPEGRVVDASRQAAGTCRCGRGGSRPGHLRVHTRTVLASIGPPMWPGTRPATSSSPMAMAIRGL